MKNKRVFIAFVEDWKAMYVDGICIEQGHTLGDGNNFFFLLEMSEKYNFSSKDITSAYFENDKISQYVFEKGVFPESLKEWENIC